MGVFRAVVSSAACTALLSTGPQTLQVVELTSAGGHHVNDHVVHVQQNPVAVALAFFAQRLDAQSLDRFADLVEHRADLTVGRTGSDDHEVSDAVLVTNVDNLNVLGLDVFQSSYSDLDQLFALERLAVEGFFWQRGAFECAFALYFAYIFVSHIKLVLLVCSGVSIHVNSRLETHLFQFDAR